MMIGGSHRVAVTGLGVVAPNGVGADAFWRACVAGTSGIRTIDRFDTAQFPVKIAGLVDGFQPTEFVRAELAARTDRSVHFGLAAASLALADAGLHNDLSWRRDAQVIIGSGVGGQPFQELLIADAHLGGLDSMRVPTPSSVPAHIAVEQKLGGLNLCISTACSSGANAVGEAFRMVRSGEALVALAGGVEAPITPYAFYAHCALRVLSTESGPPERVSKPFEKRREGFVIAEGAAILVLEELDSALARGARIYAELVGAASNSGMYHIAIPDPSADDLVRVMSAALRDARLEPGQIDYVNAHGTGTKANDETEVRGLEAVFGEHMKRLCVSGSKSMLGHSLGAAGAVEAAICALTLSEQVVTPTINLASPEFEYDFVADGARRTNVEYALSNSFGFGSNNSCLVFRRHRVPGADRGRGPVDSELRPA